MTRTDLRARVASLVYPERGPAQATISKTFRFEAAHQLPNHRGKCAKLHGHSYRVEVRARGEIKPASGASDEGMVLDFAELTAAWTPLYAKLDHAFLNDLLKVPTTAENIASFLLDAMRASCPQVYAVRVYETASSWAQASA